MKNKGDILNHILFGAALILLTAGLVLSFQGKATNIPTYCAAFICLIFSQLRRFESFEGLGLKAKVRELEETIDTIISSSAPDAEDKPSPPISIEALAQELGLSHSSEVALDKILSKLRNSDFSFRTSRHLAKDTGMSYPTVETIIGKLHELGYANKAHSQTKGLLWSLSAKGKAVSPLQYED